MKEGKLRHPASPSHIRGLKGRTVEAKGQIAQVKRTCFERQVCSPSGFREMGGMGRKVLARGLCMFCQASYASKLIPSAGSSLEFLSTLMPEQL